MHCDDRRRETDPDDPEGALVPGTVEVQECQNSLQYSLMDGFVVVGTVDQHLAVSGNWIFDHFAASQKSHAGWETPC